MRVTMEFLPIDTGTSDVSIVAVSGAPEKV